MMKQHFSILKAFVATNLIIAITLAIHSLFFFKNHDWDMNSFLYLGSRLGNGELLYTSDFEIKLPLVQYYFYVAHLLGGLGVWKLFSFFILTFSAFLASHLLMRVMHQSTLDMRLDKHVANFSASVYLVTCFMLPGAASAQLSMIAGALYYLAISIYIYARTIAPKPLRLFIISGFLSGMAASLRPNIFFAVSLFLFFTFLVPAADKFFTRNFRQVLLFLCGFGSVFLTSLLPYFFRGEDTKALVSGLLSLNGIYDGKNYFEIIQSQLPLRIFQSFFNVNSGPSLLYSLFFFLFHLLLYAAMIAIAFMVWKSRASIANRKKSGYFLAIFSFVATFVGLSMSFSISTWYPHYSLMYAFLPSLLVKMFHRIFFIKRFSDWSPKWTLRGGVNRSREVFYMFLTFWISLVLLVCIFLFYSDKTSFSWRINDYQVDSLLLSYLTDVTRTGSSFYVFDDVRYHTLLSESRLGDGHPYMMYLKLGNLNFGPKDALPLFEVHDTCAFILESGKDFLVLSDGGLVSERFTKCNGIANYFQEISPLQSHQILGFTVLKRIN